MKTVFYVLIIDLVLGKQQHLNHFMLQNVILMHNHTPVL